MLSAFPLTSVVDSDPNGIRVSSRFVYPNSDPNPLHFKKGKQALLTNKNLPSYSELSLCAINCVYFWVGGLWWLIGGLWWLWGVVVAQW